MNFIQPQCEGEDCCGNGVVGSTCTPIAWINACSIGYYLTDRCERDFLFRIKKNGVVIFGPSVAFSYAMTPTANEVASYEIEYCEGTAEPCNWVRIAGPTSVDTTSLAECPMGVMGQAYILGIEIGQTIPEPTVDHLYCQSQLVVRAAAVADFGLQITHLWIDDTLFTGSSVALGSLSDDVTIINDSTCATGKTFTSGGIGANDTTQPQIRLQLPMPFEKSSFSIRARQSDGLLIGCVVQIPSCTVHYNAASTTLPTWSGLNITCSASGGMPIGFMNTPAPVRFWCKYYESTTTMAAGMSGTHSWLTCQSATSPQLVLDNYAFTYNFKCSGDVRWIDPADAPPRPVYSGTFSFDHTVTCNVRAILTLLENRPGYLEIESIVLLITSDVTSTITGSNSWPSSLGGGLPAVGGVFALGTGLPKNNFGTATWFDASLVNALNCQTPIDSDLFQWNWPGPQFPSSYWKIIADDFSLTIPIAPSPIASSAYMAGVFPVDTSFVCDLPEGSYFTQTQSATAAQFQV